MSEAPLDRSERTERTEGEAGRERPSRSTLGRIADRLRTACHSVGRYVRSALDAVVGSPGPRDGTRPSSSERNVADRQDREAQYALVSDGSDADADPGSDSSPAGSDEGEDADASEPQSGTDGSPAGALPASSDAAAAGPDRDTPELQAEWDGDRLTLVSPDDADGRITSDVWEDVER